MTEILLQQVAGGVLAICLFLVLCVVVGVAFEFICQFIDHATAAISRRLRRWR